MRKSAAVEVNRDEELPIASLRLLAPPLRLVSAAMWKVMQQRDIMHYGKLEEFVTSVSETVPGLMKYRHQAKLTVGLRARLILEQLRVRQRPDPEIILSQLDRVRAPALTDNKKKDQKVEMAVKNFHTLVQTLLRSPEQRKRFFQDEFDSQYGPEYESAVEKLLWEFLIRLDQLLPVPSLAQTVSWLTSAPAVLEECARSASQPQLLRTLLQHEKCLGHMDSAGFVSSSTGDSILSSLSLPLSGKVRDTDQSSSTPSPDVIQIQTRSTPRANSRLSEEPGSQIAPVIGSITSKDLPQKAPAKQNEVSITQDLGVAEVSANTKVRTRSCRTVLKLQLHKTIISEADDDEPRAELEKKSTRRSLKKNQEMSNGKTSGVISQDETPQRAASSAAAMALCMNRQLRVLIPRLNISDITNNEKQPRKSPRPSAKQSEGATRKRKREVMSSAEKNQNGDSNKQVCAGSPCIPKLMPVRMDSPDLPSPVTESTDDVIVDSEDEAIKKVKGKLFTNRYCKTKNDTYIPTLHEFWTPAIFLRDIVSPGNRRK